MAAAFRRYFRPSLGKKYAQLRCFQTTARAQKSLTVCAVCGVGTGLAVSWYIAKKYRETTTNVYAKDSVGDGEKRRVAMQTQRELRYLSFASVEYQGCVYMTPQDFLESVTEDTPRPRTGRRTLTADEVEKLLRSTPSRGRGSSQMFRSLHDKGLISYTEYLFLICVLTKPHSGFRIAFNMFDTDGNQRVDKKEFLVLQKVLQPKDNVIEPPDRFLSRLIAIFREPYFKKNELQHTAVIRPDQAPNLWNLVRGSRIQLHRGGMGEIVGASELVNDTICSTPKGVVDVDLEQIIPGSAKNPEHDDNEGMLDRGVRLLSLLNQSSSGDLITDTTLLVHFFGKRGTDVLKYDDFFRFMDNLQTEVLELEYNEFSRGMPTITEEEFAKILLRYTILSSEDKEEYLARLQERVQDVEGISFKDFKEFCQFLNNLDDFAIAMKMYSYSGRPISEEDFRRSVKACTGQTLHPHLVHVVFQLFDIDGDGHLSHKEFFAVMKDRLRRGFRTQWSHGGWENFKTCVKTEIKTK